METPQQDAVEMFVSITGASQSVALQKLHENGWNLNQAVNAHFGEGDRIMAVPQDDLMATDHPTLGESQGAHLPLPSVTRTIHHSAMENGSGNGHMHEVLESVRFMNREDEDLTSASAATVLGHTAQADAFGRNLGHADPQLHSETTYGNDIEEQMVQAAIEASKQDVEEEYANHEFHAGDITRQEKTLPEQERLVETSQQGGFGPSGTQELGRPLTTNGRQEFDSSNSGLSNLHKLEAGNSSIQDDAEEVEEMPLVRRRSRHYTSGAEECAEEVVEEMVGSMPPVTRSQDITTHPRTNGNAFHSDEWGGISSEEHDEAVMLEAALFGGIPDGAAYGFPYPYQVPETSSNRNADMRPWPEPRPPSPTLMAERLLREQQDKEYLAALEADREKELKAMEQAEISHLQEIAAREAAFKEEKHKEEESQKKLLEEEEYERLLGAKQASLPPEPAADDIGAVTLLVRMPDGSRHGRRFLKSDKLQALLDFMDVSRVVKPGAYRLVRPYPRQAFGDDESRLSLNDVGLTSKQEALFLELI